MQTSSVKQQAAHMLDMLSRARVVFGDDQEPLAPPEPRTPRNLEDNLGLGFFGPAEPATVLSGYESDGGWSR